MRDFFIALVVVILIASFIVGRQDDENHDKPARCETSQKC
jgi:hypothetical protein